MLNTQWFARDAWFGFDKLDHFAWAMAYWLVLTAVGAHGWTRFWLFTIGAVGVEVVQLVRFRRWVRKGRPMPYPTFADGFSYKDLAWGYGGAIAAAGAIARIVARALLVLTVISVGAGSIAAQKAPEFTLRGVSFDTTEYGRDIPMYLPPLHGFILQAPAGDMIVVLNAVRFDTTMAAGGRECGPTLIRSAVAVSRLVVGRRDSVWWAQDFPERGQARLYPHWVQLLPSGDTLRIAEVWRRRTECAANDGSLVVVFSFRRGLR